MPWATRPWSSSHTRATGSPSRATPSTPSGSDGWPAEVGTSWPPATRRRPGRRSREALDLWRGPALADADDGEYAVALAARLDEERLDALAARVDADLALGHAADVVAELEDRTRANPLREQLTGQLMRALAATGRPAEALAAYERLRSTLADTLGTDPSPALRELHLALLREDVPGAQPPIGRRPGLRAGLTSFLGREAETERVVGVLTGSRLATVVGPGGAGKTRLATEVGRAWQAAARRRRIARRARAGARRERRPAGVPGRPGPARGHRPRAHPRGAPRHRRLLASGRDAQRRAVPARRRQLRAPARRRRRGSSRTSWRAAPALRVLATSREPLGVDGESLCVLPPLGLPPWDVRLDEAMAYARCGCFVDRAAAVRSGLVLDESTLAPVVEIVRRLDGLPLAIELAAARLRVLPVARSRPGCPTGSGC